MKIENIQLEGETEHHFEWLLNNMETDDDEEITPQVLAEMLLADKVFEQYVQGLRGGTQRPPQR